MFVHASSAESELSAANAKIQRLKHRLLALEEKANAELTDVYSENQSLVAAIQERNNWIQGAKQFQRELQQRERQLHQQLLQRDKQFRAAQDSNQKLTAQCADLQERLSARLVLGLSANSSQMFNLSSDFPDVKKIVSRFKSLMEEEVEEAMEHAPLVDRDDSVARFALGRLIEQVSLLVFQELSRCHQQLAHVFVISPHSTASSSASSSSSSDSSDQKVPSPQSEAVPDGLWNAALLHLRGQHASHVASSDKPHHLLSRVAVAVDALLSGFHQHLNTAENHKFAAATRKLVTKLLLSCWEMALSSPQVQLSWDVERYKAGFDKPRNKASKDAVAIAWRPCILVPANGKLRVDSKGELVLVDRAPPASSASGGSRSPEH